jgi:glycosyltransferase involved in cell wall biosynthesis
VKITHVLPAFTRGGAERVVVDLANQGVADGHVVTVVLAYRASLQQMPSRLDDRVVTKFVSGRSLRAAYAALLPWTLRNWQWLRRQDIVHCHLTFGAMFGATLQFLRRAAGSRSPVVVETYHAVGMAISRWRRLFHSVLLRSRDAVAFMADDPYWLRFRARRQNQLSTTIPNGIAWQGPTQGLPSRSGRRSEAVGANSVVIGSISRLVGERRPDLLLETVALLVRRHGVDAHLLIGGEGPARRELEAQARRLRIADRVRLPGLVTDITETLGMIDLYLTVNVGAITGIAALEAALFGLPIVAIQLQPNHAGGANDWVWSSAHPAEVAEHITALLADTGEMRKQSLAQQGYAAEHFTIGAAAQSYYRLYEAALARRAAARH